MSSKPAFAFASSCSRPWRETWVSRPRSARYCTRNVVPARPVPAMMMWLLRAFGASGGRVCILSLDASGDGNDRAYKALKPAPMTAPDGPTECACSGYHNEADPPRHQGRPCAVIADLRTATLAETFGTFPAHAAPVGGPS